MNNNNSTVKLITILDYIGILFILGFFVEKDNEDVKFHTNQGIILCIFDIAVSIVASILGVFHWIPFVGWVFSLIATLLWLLEAAGIAFFAADLVGVWNLYLFVGGLPAILVGALVLCLTVLFLGCTFYIWPLLAVFDFPLKKLLGNSFIMAVGNLPVTLTLALLWALAGVGCFYMSGVFFVWIGLAIFVSSYFINTVFKKYTGELAEEQAAWEQADRERKQRKKMQKRGLL